MANGQGVEALAREVIASAHERAHEIVAAAQARAADEVRRAQEEAATARAQVVGRAQLEAAQERARAEAAARLEARRRILATREALISRVLAEARAQLGDLSPQERQAALEKAIIESAVALGGGHLTVRASPRDAPLLTRELLQGVAGLLAARGIAAELEVGPAASILGGAIVAKDSGRIVVDHSFEARLEQHVAELRNQAWEVLAEAVPERVAL